MNKDFLFVRSDWYTKKYAGNSSARFATFKAFFNLVNQRGGKVFCESGVQRGKDDWGAGCSSTLICDYIAHYGGHLWSVDISQQSLNVCEEQTKEWSQYRTLVCQDSVEFFKTFDKREDYPGKIDGLYLDSYDYPYGELLNRYGGRYDIHKAIAILDGIPEEEIIKTHDDIIRPCQEHCLNELFAALPHCTDDTVILIDDSNLNGGGKSRLANLWLIDNGYQLILDFQQSLWIKVK